MADEKSTKMLLGKKGCSCCGEMKEFSSFHKNNSPKSLLGLQSQCKDCRKKLDGGRKVERAAYYVRTRQTRRQVTKRYQEKVRLETLTFYSKGTLCCACCGEATYEFLTLDHIGGGGNKHREEVNRRGYTFYSLLRQQGFPPGFQVLCMNCNWSKGKYGSCPHERCQEKFVYQRSATNAA